MAGWVKAVVWRLTAAAAMCIFAVSASAQTPTQTPPQTPAPTAAPTAALPPPTIDALLALPTIQQVSLSPDGQHIVGIQSRPGGQAVVTVDWRTRAAKAVLSTSYERGQDIDWVAWKSGRLLFSVSQFVNRQRRPISRSEAIANPNRAWVVATIYIARPDGSQLTALNIDQSNRIQPGTSVALVSMLPRDPHAILLSTVEVEPRLWRADLSASELIPAGSSLGSASTVRYYVDGTGRVVIRADALRGGQGFHYLRRAPNSVAWVPIIETRTSDATNSPDFQVLTAGPGANEVYVIARPDGRDFAALYLYNTATGAYGDPIYAHSSADVSGVFFNAATGAIFATCTVVKRTECTSDNPQVGRDLAALQRTIGVDAEIMIVGASADGAVWLVRSETPQNPGVYWGFDRTTRTMNRILDTVEELAGRKLAPTRVIDFTTRDGVQLWAYVTGHRSADGVPQPVVVMPHGGPEARDYYGYDPLVQLFAARGYLVVQPNFRGSEGFGLQFVRAGQGQWGKRMQDDVIDAFQALVKAGEADPERACIVGWSYGGYAALMGAARDPGLFQCVVSVAGVSDLIEMLRHDRALYTAERSSGFLYWRVSIGELGRDDDALAATSPARMADRITAPVLLIHGKVDDVVPPQQSEMMARVLRAAGKPHELLLIEGGDHTLFEIGMRKTAYARMDAFVARHLGGR